MRSIKWWNCKLLSNTHILKIWRQFAVCLFPGAKGALCKSGENKGFKLGLWLHVFYTLQLVLQPVVQPRWYSRFYNRQYEYSRLHNRLGELC